ncbi:hypothetical protein IW261DRAFT_1424949 [Armillaria novae-zelandiae]|uniref:Uncharacterized protein n=1 Tax=Armillaria novae-zelandiae TaxID=153914 RepID=A0AA39NU43_9AGAR|nr:hypothetical protein IW261DRAFT_1424949 [Armillaria novae-zelandiae]
MALLLLTSPKPVIECSKSVAASEPEGQVANESDLEVKKQQQQAMIAARTSLLGGVCIGIDVPLFGKVLGKLKPKAEFVEKEAKPVEVLLKLYCHRSLVAMTSMRIKDYQATKRQLPLLSGIRIQRTGKVK